MNDEHQLEVLDDRKWSQLWERYLKEAIAFDPLEKHEINCIIPLPDRKGVLVFTEKGCFYNTQSALNTLRHFAFAHCFPDYSIMSSVLKDIGRFGKYKFPWVCPFFVLFPLESVQHTVWINPLKIREINTSGILFYAEMVDGLKLHVPIQRYYILLRAEAACAILAAVRQDSFYFSTLGKFPKDYLTLYNTSFGNSLRKRPLLQQFVTKSGEVNRRYQRARFLHYYDELVHEPENIPWESWS